MAPWGWILVWSETCRGERILCDFNVFLINMCMSWLLLTLILSMHVSTMKLWNVVSARVPSQFNCPLLHDAYLPIPTVISTTSTGHTNTPHKVTKAFFPNSPVNSNRSSHIVHNSITITFGIEWLNNPRFIHLFVKNSLSVRAEIPFGCIWQQNQRLIKAFE